MLLGSGVCGDNFAVARHKDPDRLLSYRYRGAVVNVPRAPRSRFVGKAMKALQ
jgi:hypothetical protein